MSENDEATVIANRVLDRPSADPDDDLAILARQLLRAREEIARLAKIADAATKLREHQDQFGQKHIKDYLEDNAKLWANFDAAIREAKP